MFDTTFEVSKNLFLQRKGVEGFYAEGVYKTYSPHRTLTAKGKSARALGRAIFNAMPDGRGYRRECTKYDTPEFTDPQRARTTSLGDRINQLIINVQLTNEEIREVWRGYGAAQKVFCRKERRERKLDAKTM